MKTRKILFVDDNDRVRRTMEIVLSRLDWEVSCADGGRAALAMADLSSPDLILLDLSMPGMDGMETLRALKRRSGTRDIPVVIFSAALSRSRIRAAEAAGAVDCLAKADLDVQTLQERLQAALEAGGGNGHATPATTPVAEPARAAQTAAAATSDPKPGATDEPEADSEPDAAVPETLSQEMVERRLHKIHSARPMPFVAAEIVSRTREGTADVKGLVTLLRKDPALASRVLKMANSSFYRALGRSESLDRAVVNLGYHGVRDLAMSADLVRAVGNDADDQTMAFWRHSLGVAVIARALTAGLPGDHCPEQAFLAGLVHDTGVSLLREALPEHYDAIMAEARRAGRHLTDVERERLGRTHAEVGVEALERWHLPEDVVRAVGQHHAPPADLLASGGDHLAAVLQAADRLAAAWRIGNVGCDRLFDLPDELCEAVHLDPSKLDDLHRQVSDEMDDLTEILLLHRPDDYVGQDDKLVDGRIVLVGHGVPGVDAVATFLERVADVCRMDAPDEPAGDEPVQAVVTRSNGHDAGTVARDLLPLARRLEARLVVVGGSGEATAGPEITLLDAPPLASAFLDALGAA